MSLWETERTKQACEQLKETGLFTDEELRTANDWFQESFESINITSNGIANNTLVGISPRKAGILLGINGNSMQNRCGYGGIKAPKNVFGEWVIPVDEIIRLRKEQIAKNKIKR